MPHAKGPGKCLGFQIFWGQNFKVSTRRQIPDEGTLGSEYVFPTFRGTIRVARFPETTLDVRVDRDGLRKGL